MALSPGTPGATPRVRTLADHWTPPVLQRRRCARTAGPNTAVGLPHFWMFRVPRRSTWNNFGHIAGVSALTPSRGSRAAPRHFMSGGPGPPSRFDPCLPHRSGNRAAAHVRRERRLGSVTGRITRPGAAPLGVAAATPGKACGPPRRCPRTRSRAGPRAGCLAWVPLVATRAAEIVGRCRVQNAAANARTEGRQVAARRQSRGRGSSSKFEPPDPLPVVGNETAAEGRGGSSAAACGLLIPPAQRVSGLSGGNLAPPAGEGAC